MKLRVLGCSGGQVPGHNLSCFLIDDRLLIDAGSVTAALPLSAQSKITDVLITHIHLDHVLSLGLLADNLYGRAQIPINVWSTPVIIEGLKKHFFNDNIWPDFTQITSPGQPSPVLKLFCIAVHEPAHLGAYMITPVEVQHAVPSIGFFIKNKNKTLIHLGDTGPTEEVWSRANSAGDLGAVIVETSFPNRLQEVADASQHLTPQTLAGEITKLGAHDVPILVTHLKPRFRSEIVSELKKLKDPRIRILEDGDVLRL